jgi:glycine/D-amino acid oxidase-like deaminating enzyme
MLSDSPATASAMSSPLGTVDSLWTHTLSDPVAIEPLEGETEADVVIVGAGLTGLWTAVSLLRADPSLRVVVLERYDIGFGASGRNGGWASALSAVSLTALERLHGRQGALDLDRALVETVDILERENAEHHLDPGAVRSGSISMIRSANEAERARERLAEARRFGLGEDYMRWLNAAEAREMINATNVQGALFTPHCLAVHPARFTHGVARLVLSLGGTIGRATVTDLRPGVAHTTSGNVRAPVVLRCTEAYTATLSSARRDVIPIYSMMVATEPLDEDVWAEIGLQTRPTFDDFRHMIIYGQRTDDHRIAFGGRGAGYLYGSRIDPRFDTDQAIRARLEHSLRELFPILESTAITHHWGGPLAMPRDQHASVLFDPRTGLGSAGGYVGDGVASTNLAGRILADLVVGAESELTNLAWVGHRSRRWEPEPLRWLGVTAVRRSADIADNASGPLARVARLGSKVVHKLTGR